MRNTLLPESPNKSKKTPRKGKGYTLKKDKNDQNSRPAKRTTVIEHHPKSIGRWYCRNCGLALSIADSENGLCPSCAEQRFNGEDHNF